MKFARLQTTTLGLLATASLGLAACSGGGGSAPTALGASSTANPPAVTTKSSATKLGVTLAGASQVYALRHNLAIEGTPIRSRTTARRSRRAHSIRTALPS